MRSSPRVYKENARANTRSITCRLYDSSEESEGGVYFFSDIMQLAGEHRAAEWTSR